MNLDHFILWSAALTGSLATGGLAAKLVCQILHY
jgi:hypothetical protein